MTQSFDLPVDVPWKWIAGSPDMMAPVFGLGEFPPAWRSSLAIYAYEPSPDDLPTELCDQKLTYLKITCSITGYQPTAEETAALTSPHAVVPVTGPATPTDENPVPVPVPFPASDGNVLINTIPSLYGDFADAYFACYGALLNVSVFPSVSTVPQSSPVAQGLYNFAVDSANREYPNPLAASSDGLTFTLSGAGVTGTLPIVLDPDGHSFVLQIPSGVTLEIDLPLSTNVVLQLWATTGSSGTITAYDFQTIVYQTTLSSASTGTLTSFPISVTNPITRLIVSSADDNTYLSTVQYSSLERPTTIADYPHIVDFEPKMRDLYQAATDQAELLTGSSSSINAGKSMASTSSSEMGMSLTGGYSSGKSAGPNVSGTLTGKWGNTSTDASNTEVDQSRESRETQGTTTNITQQYNLLTGYHAGTNRATFLWLPRPHTLQATDYRTFIRGLRMIEGVQEFFLIVSRSTLLPGLCIEAALETGHFPENVTLGPAPSPIAPPPPTETMQIPVPAYVPGNNWNSQSSATQPGGTPQPSSQTLSIPSPWIVDVTKNIPGTQGGAIPGVSWTVSPSAGISLPLTPAEQAEYQQALNSMNVQVTATDNTVTYGVTVSSGAQFGSAARAQVIFTVYLTQSSASTLADAEQVVVSDFLVTSRDLQVCINSCASDNCVTLAPTQQVPYSQSSGPTQTVAAGSSPVPSGGSPATTVGPNASFAKQSRIAIVGKSVSAGSTARGRTKSRRAPTPPPAAAHAYKMPTTATPQSGATPAPSTKTLDIASPRSSIVYEARIKVPHHVVKPEQLRQSRTPAAREVMHQIKHHMLNGWRMPQRHPHGEVGFLESDHFCRRARERLPQRYLTTSIAHVKGLSPQLVGRLGSFATVGDVLNLDLHVLRFRAGVDLAQAIALRRLLLGFGPSQPTAGVRAPQGSASRASASAMPGKAPPPVAAAKQPSPAHVGGRETSARLRRSSKRKAAKKARRA